MTNRFLDARLVLGMLPPDLIPSPLGLFVDVLVRRWQIRGRLRGSIPDSQITGYGLSVLGALCEAFRISEAGKLAGARWEQSLLAWETPSGIEKSDPAGPEFLPAPVAQWWNLSHLAVITAKELNALAPVANDHAGWTFDQFAILLAFRFGVSLGPL